MLTTFEVIVDDSEAHPRQFSMEQLYANIIYYAKGMAEEKNDNVNVKECLHLSVANNS